MRTAQELLEDFDNHINIMSTRPKMAILSSANDLEAQAIIIDHIRTFAENDDAKGKKSYSAYCQSRGLDRFFTKRQKEHPSPNQRIDREEMIPEYCDFLRGYMDWRSSGDEPTSQGQSEATHSQIDPAEKIRMKNPDDILVELDRILCDIIHHPEKYHVEFATELDVQANLVDCARTFIWDMESNHESRRSKSHRRHSTWPSNSYRRYCVITGAGARPYVLHKKDIAKESNQPISEQALVKDFCAFLEAFLQWRNATPLEVMPFLH